MAAIATLPTRAGAYRTAANQRDFPTDQQVRWETAVVDMELVASTPAHIEVGAARSALDRAAATWSAVECAAAPDTTPAILTSWGDDAEHGDGVASVAWLAGPSWERLGYGDDVAATTDVLYRRDRDGQWSIVDADVYVNAEGFRWDVAATTSGEGRDTAAVLTHELGHVLGLLHPCEPGGAGAAPRCETHPTARDTVMYPRYRGATQRTLSDDDVAGMCFLYGPSPCRPGCSELQACVDGSCLAACGDAVCAPDEVCGAGGCQPAECPTGMREDDGTCVRGEGVFGDPCAVAADCRSAHCSGEAGCAISCGVDDWCPLGTECREDGAIPLCVADGGAFGDGCRQASDCHSRSCVGSDRHAPFCSRSCGDDTPCPTGFACADVDGDTVCVVAASSNAGCRATATHSQRPFAAFVGIALVVLGHRRRDGAVR